MSKQTMLSPFKSILLVALLLLIINCILRTISSYPTAGDLIWVKRLFNYISVFLVWFFIGKQIGNTRAGWQTGLIAIGLSLVSLVLNKYIPKPTPSYDATFPWYKYLIPIIRVIVPIIIFAVLTLKSTFKKIYFTILCFVINYGISSAYYYDNTDFIRIFFRLFNISRYSLFQISIKESNTSTSYINLDSEFIEQFIFIIVFILFTYFYRVINSRTSFTWSFLKEINPILSYSKLKMTFVFLFLYTLSICLSIGIIFNTSRVFESSIIISSLRIISSILCLFIMCWFLRKKLIEFYVSHGKTISWHYYFSLFPFIGIFVWLFNLHTFRKKEDTASYIHLMNNENNNAKVFIVVIAIFYLVALVFQNPENIAFIIISLFPFLIYISHKNGLNILIGLQFVLLITLISLEHYNIITIPPNIIKPTFFTSMVFACLFYPIFHLKHFKLITATDLDEGLHIKS